MTAITRSSMVAAMCVVAAVALGAAVTRANPQKFAVGGGPEAVAFDGSYLWVTNQFTDTVTKMIADGSIVGTYGVGERPLGVATDGQSVWVANHDSNTVSRLNAADGGLVSTFPVGQGPGGLAYHDGHLWVANRTANTVMKLQASDGVLEATARVGRRPMGVAISTTAAGNATSTFVWVTNNQDKTVTKIRESSGGVVGTYPVGDGPFGAIFDGANVWISNFFGGTVMRLGIDGAVQASYPTGDGASGMLFDGSSIWVANHGDDTITKLRASDGARLDTLEIGEGPFGVSSDGHSLWVSNFGSDEVAKLPDAVARPLAGAGLVLALGFNEAGGTTAFDASPARNTGTISGALRVAGRDGAGGALAFDGVNDSVSVAGSSSLDLRDAVTLEAWVRPNSLTGAAADKWRTVVMKQGSTGLAYALYGNEAGAARPAGFVDLAGIHQSTAAGPSLPATAWTHLAMTFENGTLRLYVNGVERSSAAFAGAVAATPGAPLRIGGNTTWGEWFSGLIDDVRVYNRALQASEIQADMTAPVP